MKEIPKGTNIKCKYKSIKVKRIVASTHKHVKIVQSSGSPRFKKNATTYGYHPPKPPIKGIKNTPKQAPKIKGGKIRRHKY